MPTRQPTQARPAKNTAAARKTEKARAPAEAARADWQRGAAAPGGASPQAILAMQRRFGNRAVAGLLQPKRANVAAQPPAHPLLRASAAATRTATRLIQRKSALVSAKTTTRQFKGPRTDNRDNDVQAVEDSPKGVTYARLEAIELYDGRQANITDKAGNVGWFRIKSGKGAGEFIRGSKVIGGLGPGEATPAEQEGQGQEMSGLDISNQFVSGADAALVEIYRGATMEQPSDRTKALSAITNSPEAQARIEFAEGATWIGSGILGMAASLRDLMDKDKSAFDKLLASIGMLSGAAAIAGGVSQIVQYANFDKSIAAAGGTQTSETYNQAAKSGGFMVGFGDMFNSLTNGLKTIKSIVDLVKMVAEGKKYDVDQGVKLGTDILSNGLQTATSVLRTVRGFNEVISHSQTATSQFGSVLPGLDIAVAAIGIIQNGYYLVVSAISMRKMYQRKVELEGQLRTEHNLEQADIKAAGKRYRTEEAQEATTDQLIKRATADYNKLSVKKFRAKSDAERARLTQQQVAVKAELDLLKQQKAAQDAQKGTGTFGQYSGSTADVLRERELASNTHIANKRRVTRQAVHIGTKLIQIGGAIATFVSGPGAPAAMTLKLSAMGIDSSLPFWRWLKEKGRNQAAANRAKGGTGWTNKIFNADKSKAAKSRSRHKDAVLILQMVGKLGGLMPTAADNAVTRRQRLQQLRPQALRVEGYIRATGCPPQKLYAANGNPTEQVKILVTEISKREL